MIVIELLYNFNFVTILIFEKNYIGQRFFSIKVLYIYVIYIPDLKLRIAVSEQERKQGRFRGSNEGAIESTMGQRRGAAGRNLNWLLCTRL